MRRPLHRRRPDSPGSRRARALAQKQIIQDSIDQDWSMTNTASSELTVSARSLSRNYGTIRAVREVTLELRRGEVLGLLGPNGAGKTTAMQMLTGNLAPTSGEVDICGINLVD